MNFKKTNKKKIFSKFLSVSVGIIMTLNSNIMATSETKINSKRYIIAASIVSPVLVVGVPVLAYLIYRNFGKNKNDSSILNEIHLDNNVIEYIEKSSYANMERKYDPIDKIIRSFDEMVEGKIKKVDLDVSSDNNPISDKSKKNKLNFAGFEERMTVEDKRKFLYFYNLAKKKKFFSFYAFDDGYTKLMDFFEYLNNKNKEETEKSKYVSELEMSLKQKNEELDAKKKENLEIEAKIQEKKELEEKLKILAVQKEEAENRQIILNEASLFFSEFFRDGISFDPVVASHKLSKNFLDFVKIKEKITDLNQINSIFNVFISGLTPEEKKKFLKNFIEELSNCLNIKVDYEYNDKSFSSISMDLSFWGARRINERVSRQILSMINEHIEPFSDVFFTINSDSDASPKPKTIKNNVSYIVLYNLNSVMHTKNFAENEQEYLFNNSVVLAGMLKPDEDTVIVFSYKNGENNYNIAVSYELFKHFLRIEDQNEIKENENTSNTVGCRYHISKRLESEIVDESNEIFDKIGSSNKNSVDYCANSFGLKNINNLLDCLHSA